MIIVLMVFLIGLGNSFAQHIQQSGSDGIQFFEGSWEQALQK